MNKAVTLTVECIPTRGSTRVSFGLACEDRMKATNGLGLPKAFSLSTSEAKGTWVEPYTGI